MKGSPYTRALFLISDVFGQLTVTPRAARAAHPARVRALAPVQAIKSRRNCRQGVVLNGLGDASLCTCIDAMVNDAFQQTNSESFHTVPPMIQSHSPTPTNSTLVVRRLFRRFTNFVVGVSVTATLRDVDSNIR